MIYKILKYSVLLIVLFVLTPFVGYSQVGGNNSLDEIYRRNQNNNNMGLSEDALMMQQDADTLGGKKEKRIKKPMESYLFSDSTKNQNIYSWKFNPYTNNIKITEIDTMLDNFQKDYIFFQQEQTGVIYNGNLGGASTPIDYFNRVSTNEFSFLNAYNAYLFTPNNVPFYNSKRPFTQLSFFMSGQSNRAEEQLRVIHSQNISPTSSINITYRNNGTRGMYHSQRSTDKNLSLAFNHSGKKYTVHGGYIYNMGDIGENGGITNDFFVKDTLVDLAENIPTNMQDAKNLFKSHTFYITQSYGMPFKRLNAEEGEFDIRNKSAIFFGHSLEYTTAKKVYTDEASNIVDDYYQNWYINPTMSRDSINETSLDTRLFVQIQPYDRDGLLSLIGGGLGYKNESYYYFKPQDYIFNGETINENSIYAYANAEGKLREYLHWNGNFKYYPIGFRSQDMRINGNLLANAYVNDKPIQISASVLYRMESPSLWTEQYYSNHYQWNNSFPKENETRFEGAIKIPSYGIELGAKQSITTNKVYFDQNSLPALYDGTLSVSAVYLQKDFRLGGLNLKNRVLLQWSSSQNVAPVPLLSANGTYYYELNVVKNVLRMQFGVEGYYNSSYYGFGYNPAIMQFYNQQTTQTGDYIWMDAFITGKWKRLRFIVKMQHLNYEIFGGRNYFQVAHYPLNRRMLKLGVSWNFYD